MLGGGCSLVSWDTLIHPVYWPSQVELASYHLCQCILEGNLCPPGGPRCPWELTSQGEREADVSQRNGIRGSTHVQGCPKAKQCKQGCGKVGDVSVGSVSCVCPRCVCDAAHRCSRPRSKERAVVVAWERRLMVVGDAPESIQYPWRAACGGGRGKEEREGHLPGPISGCSWEP